ncbi:MAG: hypothetical protein GWM92_05380 [Gemmatimonadetes bacterium]|nr:hypothetical protein [Gemmatimonadota bacterium]NIR78572.1 hypothetical protein [Gemmatimonadota bacterium]NIT86573.1 hypothetical protein [Gemmatimonadota bacterium]NIU31026.1 hypothetical protein [Gemmatimonadota bacterium]NIU35780.1 hypothetical protein [Gemmatimonadota bacterium]
MTQVDTGIVAALPEEVEEILARLVGEDGPPVPGRSRPQGLQELRWGRLSARPVVVAVTGDGRRNALRGTRALLGTVAPRRLLVVGVAGGLVEGAEAGRLVAGRVVWREEGGPLTPARSLLASLVESGIPRGAVATVDDLLDTPETKRRVARRLTREGLELGLAVADLESAHCASVAEERGIPWAVLRCVSDEADEVLPAFLDRCRDDGGAVDRSRVARHLLLHPRELPAVLRLRRRVRRCAEHLADAVEIFLRERAA